MATALTAEPARPRVALVAGVRRRRRARRRAPGADAGCRRACRPAAALVPGAHRGRRLGLHGPRRLRGVAAAGQRDGRADGRVRPGRRCSAGCRSPTRALPYLVSRARRRAGARALRPPAAGFPSGRLEDRRVALGRGRELRDVPRSRSWWPCCWATRPATPAAATARATRSSSPPTTASPRRRWSCKIVAGLALALAAVALVVRRARASSPFQRRAFAPLAVAARGPARARRRVDLPRRRST